MDPWMLVPLAAILMWGLQGIARARAGGDTRGLREEVRALRGEVERLRDGTGTDGALEQRVAELEERVDFAERLLARQEPRRPLPEG
ncbi:MAG TPA: hypothetical protein VFH97_09420 [Gemmatimonadales bacterium]|nr:hypothetical protein [Gemmatimonadales bacterium]